MVSGGYTESDALHVDIQLDGQQGLELINPLTTDEALIGHALVCT